MSHINGRQICNTCHGAGHLGKQVTDANGNTWIETRTCGTCHGTGWQSGGSAS